LRDKGRLIRLPAPTRGLRIGLMGGSFNPAHAGHRHVALTALTRLNLDRIWWIVARGNPLKSGQGNFVERLASARAIARHPRMIVTDIEAQAGLTYSADTLAALIARAPGAQFVWVMGADSLAQFHLWRRWPSIAQAMPVCVVARPGYGLKARASPFARRFAKARLPSAAAASLAFHAPPAWIMIEARHVALSSTALRAQAVQNAKPWLFNPRKDRGTL
jgi:nicotinate-nucleotide adenylyltransferase